MSVVAVCGTTAIVLAVVAVTTGWLTGGHGSRPLAAPTAIAGASAGLVTVTQENVSPAIPSESGVVVGFEGGQYLIATSSQFILPASVSVPGTHHAVQATSYACMDGPWRLLAVSAADVPPLRVLKLGGWGAGPAWLSMGVSETVGVRITGPVDPGQFSLWDWGADPSSDMLEFSPSVARAIDGPPAFAPAEFHGAALLQRVSGGVLLVGLGDGLLGNGGNTAFVGVATGVEDIKFLLKHPGGCFGI